jgi:hypothetical protein
MHLKAQSKNAVRYGNPRHDTIEDVSWDLGSVEHRVVQLESIVTQLKSDISELKEELLDVRQDRRPPESDSSIPYKNNGHDGGRNFPSVGPADS